MAQPAKSEIRKKILIKRDGIPLPERVRDSAIIRQRLFNHPLWEDLHTVMAYISFGSEVETHKLVQEALDAGKRIVVPVCDRERKEMRLSELRSMGDLAPGAFPGTYEPSPQFQNMVDPSEVELVLVPGAVFDQWGGRIGRGEGYFDRLLPQMPNAVRIALAFSLQVLKTRLPLLPHDMRMHQIITENDVIDAKAS
jgi:5-formyltetrahydrofolate cyclo-ligase